MPEKRKLSFTLHGQEAMNKRVVASVFAAKILAIVRGLRSADASVNGGRFYEYVIAGLGTGSAYAAFDEVVTSRKMPVKSAVATYGDCIDALSHSDFRKALRFGATVDQVAALAEGAGEQFAHGELAIDDGKAFRVDEFLARQADLAKRLRDEDDAGLKYYAGTAVGSFDGEIQEVDLRGDLQRVKLILTAGGSEIDCVLRGFTLDQVRAVLGARVWAEGEAVYSGESGLPVRLEISKIAPIKPKANFRRWKGSFAPFELTEWESDTR